MSPSDSLETTMGDAHLLSPWGNIHFRANTLGKGMNPLILPPAMGK